MTAAAMATTATVEAARITRHSFPGDPLVKTTSTQLYHSRERPSALELLLMDERTRSPRGHERGGRVSDKHAKARAERLAIFVGLWLRRSFFSAKSFRTSKRRQKSSMSRPACARPA
jgi:hypothetical protein